MTTKKQGLGRGLEALLAATKAPSVFDLDKPTHNTGLLELEITCLSPGRYQPRSEIAEADLESLADSIRAQGIIQPVVVRHLSDNKYEIIAGERRWRAAQMAGLSVIPAIIKDVSHDKAMAIALIENIQREDLSVLEEAQALERLIEEFNLTHIQVAEAIGKSRVAVTNLLRLLTLSEDVKKLLARGEIEAGHAKVLLGLRGQQQSKIATMVATRGLSVRETEKLIAQLLDKDLPKFKPRTFDPDIRRLQESLSEKLGASVDISHGQSGKGKITIQYNSLDELEGILEKIH